MLILSSNKINMSSTTIGGKKQIQIIDDDIVIFSKNYLQVFRCPISNLYKKIITDIDKFASDPNLIYFQCSLIRAKETDFFNLVIKNQINTDNYEIIEDEIKVIISIKFNIMNLYDDVIKIQIPLFLFKNNYDIVKTYDINQLSDFVVDLWKQNEYLYGINEINEKRIIYLENYINGTSQINDG